LNLHTLGWRPLFENEFAKLPQFPQPEYQAGRVALEHTHLYRVYTEQGDVLAEVSGKMRYEAVGRGDFPAVGDWVVLRRRDGEDRATIHAILPRFSKFSRKMAGLTTEEQIVAANVDTVFLVMALNNDFNVRRLERYLVLAWESGANPVIVLTKADLCDDVENKLAEVEGVAFGLPVHVVSAHLQEGTEALAPYLGEGQTIALLGSSGVGKSTLVNALAGDVLQAVQDIRTGDDRGRHTTTHRELIILPQGGLMMDTPGMREIQLWDAGDGLQGTFEDIEEFTQACRFNDCTHGNEPGCAVQVALASGTLDADRYRSYEKLQRELRYLARREDKRAQAAEKEKWKKITMGVKARQR
jgi:ribosome biogenesis GTPase / thiamine phosphate phosphatase